MLRSSMIALVIALTVVGCKKTENQSEKKEAEVVLQIAPEDILTIQTNSLAAGPVVTGTIQPERKADLRSEISSVVLQVLKQNGEAVHKGDLLVRLDDTSIRDSLHSAEESLRVATQNLEQMERQSQRMARLKSSGMASTQESEDAESRRNAAKSDLVAEKAKLSQARQQLQRTEVRAPFDGITSESKVSAGDTAQIGKELIKVIDPSSMRLEGLVSADKVGSVKVGQSVYFHVNGYGDQGFLGKVKRVNPAANATTRQVEVLVEFDDKNQPKISGLYAEGRIEATNVSSLLIKSSALVRTGDMAYVWRIKDGALKKISVVLGERDPRRGDYVVTSGLANGDIVVRSPTSTLKDGQKVRFVSAQSPAQAKAIKPVAASTQVTEK